VQGDQIVRPDIALADVVVQLGDLFEVLPIVRVLQNAIGEAGEALGERLIVRR